jgi:hypothetical protein
MKRVCENCKFFIKHRIFNNGECRIKERWVKQPCSYPTVECNESCEYFEQNKNNLEGKE